MTRTIRRTFAASAATIALVALAGCGSDDDATKASDATAASSSTSASADASDTDASASASSGDSASSDQQAGQTVSAEEFGAKIKKALDQATTANVTIDSSAGLKGTGQIDYTADPQAVKMTATLPQVGDVDMILVGKTIYMKGAMLGGDKWVKIDLSDPNSPLGAIGDQLDPAASLAKLVDGVKSATYVGQEQVDGDELDHYTATIDTASLLKDMGGSSAAATAGMGDSVDYDMWFDQDGFIRKFSVDLGSTAGTTTGTFDDWGSDVDITAPPASQVTTMPGM